MSRTWIGRQDAVVVLTNNWVSPRGYLDRQPEQVAPRLKGNQTRSIFVYDNFPPSVSVTYQSRQKVSRQAQNNSLDITIRANEDVSAYEIRIVDNESASRGQGSMVKSGGPIQSDSDVTVNINDSEIISAGAAEGPNGFKVFVMDTSGNWSS